MNGNSYRPSRTQDRSPKGRAVIWALLPVLRQERWDASLIVSVIKVLQLDCASFRQ